MTTINVASHSEPAYRGLIARHSLITFSALAIAFSWVAALPAVLFGAAFQPYQTLGACGPLLAAFVVSAASDGRNGIKTLLHRMTIWRFGIGTYLLAMFGLVILYLLTVVLSAVLPIQSLSEKWPLIFTFYIPALFTTYLINPIGEETGWTGFALHHLQNRFRPWLSALILGVVWALWHLPAYFIPSEMGAFNVFGFVIFMFIAISTRVIWTWITNTAKGSGLAGVLLHASSNAVSVGLIPLLLPTPQSSSAEDLSGPILLGLLLLSAVLILIFTRGQLSYREAI
jgi:membrane protease YdiL (CAAX protease family)